MELVQIVVNPDETRVFVGHDYGPGGREIKWETTIGGTGGQPANTVDGRFIGRLTPDSDRFNGAFEAGQGVLDRRGLISVLPFEYESIGGTGGRVVTTPKRRICVSLALALMGAGALLAFHRPQCRFRNFACSHIGAAL